jgi:hypothetical protein
MIHLTTKLTRCNYVFPFILCNDAVSNQAMNLI